RLQPCSPGPDTPPAKLWRRSLSTRAAAAQKPVRRKGVLLMSNEHQSPEAQKLAQDCAESMYARDEASRNLGMEITHVSPGKATVTMPVTSIMIQGHGSCHGGYLFTLADSAFAFACNSYNKATVASGCSIQHMLGAREGDA